jgi:hypothetical protein
MIIRPAAGAAACSRQKKFVLSIRLMYSQTIIGSGDSSAFFVVNQAPDRVGATRSMLKNG